MKTYDEFIHQLADREFFGQRLGVERIRSVLGRLGNPETQFPSIHIAGTNGKGSTAAMIASILRESGRRVGLYTSPHLIDFCERVQILRTGDSPAGGPPPAQLHCRGMAARQDPSHISTDQVLHWAKIIHEVEDPADPLTFFELATAIAFLHYAREKVDIAVIEVGLGGRLDATNVITPLVSVITSIGLDHTGHLGGTIEKIAFEKAGIIKPGVPVVVGKLPEEAMGVMRRIASEKGSRVENPPSNISDLFRHPPLSKGGIGTGGDHGGGILNCIHQLQNAAVAVGVIEELKKQDWPISDHAIQAGLLKTQLPGRLETVQEEPWILLDGAHNPQAMAAVRLFLETRLEGRRLKVLFGAMADKDIQGVLSELSPITDQFIFTAPDLKRAADPESLIPIGSSLGIKSRALRGVREAFASATKDLQKNEVLLVTGSFYLVGEVRQRLKLV
ncbi:MAG: bifunctional folylpolyglutamate synthase/dihydrofolate synthase [Deltaproteobacteria bacterium]|nr:bifunctional folylpolyglutamate synthase/dihydrofolate synthase [Deltaproteobacteria bacterium]